MVLNLGVCELFHPKIHGYDRNSTKGVKGHYIVKYTINTEEFMNHCDYEDIEIDLDILKEGYKELHEKKYLHSIIRNYNNIIVHPQYTQLELFDMIRLQPGDEDIAIKKTYWLRIFQKKWRAYYKYKQAFVKHCSNINNIRFREIHGHWPPMN